MGKTLIFLFIASGVFVFLLFAAAIIVGAKRNMADVKSPQYRRQAVVRSKRTNSVYHRGGPHNLRVRHTSYYVTFSCAGEELEFKISPDEFDRFDEGQTGLLTYQGSRFISFYP